MQCDLPCHGERRIFPRGRGQRRQNRFNLRDVDLDGRDSPKAVRARLPLFAGLLELAI